MAALHIDPNHIAQIVQADQWLDDSDTRTIAQITKSLFPPKPQATYHTSRKFNPVAYVEAYPDVADYPFHPLVHYLTHGISEGRKPLPSPPKRMATADTTTNVPLWVECNDLSFTGAPLAALDLYKGLFARFGRQPSHVGSPYNGPLSTVWDTQGTCVVSHGITPVRPHGAALIKYAQNLLDHTKVKGVHAHSILSYPFVLAAKNLNLPCIWTIHEPNTNDINDMHHNTLCDAFRSATDVIFVSPSSAHSWGQYTAQAPSIKTIPKAVLPHTPNPTQARQTLGLKSQDICILSVGTVCERKGQVDIIDMLENWSDPDPNLQFIIAGFDQSPYAQDLYARCQNLTHSGWRIKTFPNSENWQDRKHIQTLFDSADICLMTSRAESAPLVISEAFQSHCPVIASDVAGIADMIAPHHTGLLYRPTDTNSLRRAILWLSADQQRRQNMRRAIAKNLTSDCFDRMLDQYSSLFSKSFQSVWPFEQPHFIPK